MRDKSGVDLGREEIARKWDEWREEKLYLDYIVCEKSLFNKMGKYKNKRTMQNV